MTARRRRGAAGAVAFGVVLTMAACSRPSEKTAADVSAPVSVDVATVAMTDVADTFEAGGVVQARAAATLTARILAPVREVRVAPGDRVRAGQVLIVLDGSDLSARARSAAAAARAAEQESTAAAAEKQAADAALVLARTTHERVAGLLARRSATAQELDDAIAALRAAEARAAGAAARALAVASGVESARAASEAASTTESFASITAPFDGIVSEKFTEPGNMAAPGMALLRVEDTRGFRLDVRVDESRVRQIAPGASVPVSLESGAGGATATVSGTVTEVARAVDADARASLVKIALPDQAGLHSGAFGRARFSSQARRMLTVPAGALVHRGQMTSVFVVEKGIARVRLVNVSGSEALAGLTDGDVVIIAAPPTVTDGSRVTAGARR